MERDYDFREQPFVSPPPDPRAQDTMPARPQRDRNVLSALRERRLPAARGEKTSRGNDFSVIPANLARSRANTRSASMPDPLHPLSNKAPYLVGFHGRHLALEGPVPQRITKDLARTRIVAARNGIPHCADHLSRSATLIFLTFAIAFGCAEATPGVSERNGEARRGPRRRRRRSQ